jgi:hypothetical protein
MKLLLIEHKLEAPGDAVVTTAELVLQAATIHNGTTKYISPGSVTDDELKI